MKESLGPTFEKEHHQPRVPAEGGHVDGTPPVPGGHPHVGPEPDQELPDVSTGLASFLGYLRKARCDTNLVICINGK